MYGRLREQDGLPAVHLVNDRKKERRTGSNLLYLYLKKKKDDRRFQAMCQVLMHSSI